MATLPSPEHSPNFIVLAGINGAGKSTLADQLAVQPDLRNARFLNPDAETAAALASQPGMTQGTAEFVGLRIVLEAIRRLMTERASIVTETVFASRTIMRLLQTAKEAGYQVSVLFVAVATVEDSIARVALRVSAGGHNVPEREIRRRWPLAHANLALAVRLGYEVYVYENQGFGSVPRLAAFAEDGRVTFLLKDALPAVRDALLSPL